MMKSGYYENEYYVVLCGINSKFEMWRYMPNVQIIDQTYRAVSSVTWALGMFV